MLKTIFRKFSAYKVPEKYPEFAEKLKISESSSYTSSIEDFNRSSITFRKVELEDYDFVTESSDFDTERFSFKEYLWDVMWLRNRTKIKLIGCLLIWGLIGTSSKILYVLSKRYWISITPIGYFGMVEQAYYDIELERQKQRLKFSVLHSYD
jgi:hypothetical protein